MAALQQQKQQQLFNEDSLASFNSKANKSKENTFFSTFDQKSKDNQNQNNTEDENRKTLKAFLSESLLYDPKLKRRSLAKDYEKPVSDRESWWRVTIKETPLPQAYETRQYSFLTEIMKRPGTYRFKSDGRKIHPTPQIGRGEYLMPGAYEFEDLSTKLIKNRTTYGFRGPEREVILEKSMRGAHDKNIDVSPNAYNTEKYNQIISEVEPAKYGNFKSRTKRKVFKPKEGPPPGTYEPSVPRSAVAVSSCFKSKTSRFNKPHTLTPGPGAYWPVTNVSKDVEKLGEKGVFFTPNFKNSN